MAALVDYYAGLAADQLDRDGSSRGPIDYYLDPNEPAGRWWGQGRGSVGLAGDLQPEQLAAMLQARHPGHGRRFGRGFGPESARAYDATFSAPKSVSVLWALSPEAFVRAEVLAAHDAAVVAALDSLEHHGGVTRRGKDGIHQVAAQGLVAALFRQHTSREADPQLHTHAVIWAKVQDPTGKWLSLDARFLKYQQRCIGWVYAAALRSELSARLGVSWSEVSEGHANIEGLPEGLLKLFSQRNAQVETALARSVAAWVDDHDGAEPDPRTLYRLERSAVLASRPGKSEPIEADQLRAEWAKRATHASFEALALPDGQHHLPGVAGRDDETVITSVTVDTSALTAVAASSSTWPKADLAREIAARLPAEAASSADGVVQVDRRVGRASRRPMCGAAPTCGIRGEMSPRWTADHRTRGGSPAQRSGRPGPGSPAAGLGRNQRRRRQDHSPCRGTGSGNPRCHRRGSPGAGRRPAGTGKTTMLTSAVSSLRAQGRGVVGLAHSGKAADVLGRETASPATTLAKLLHEHSRVDGPRREWRMPPDTTLILDEAGMTATEDLARLMALADRHRWRLVCLGAEPGYGHGGHHRVGLNRGDVPVARSNRWRQARTPVIRY